MKLFNKYMPLFIVIILGTVGICQIHSDYSEDKQVDVIEYKLIKTEESNFGYNPKTKEYEVTSISALNNMKVKSPVNEKIKTKISTSSSCKEFINYVNGEYVDNTNCMVDLPVGINKVKLVDKVSIPLELSQKEIENPKNTITKKENGELTVDVSYYYTPTGIENNYYKYWSIDNTKGSFREKLNNVNVKNEFWYYNTKIIEYGAYILFVLICTWAAKIKGEKSNRFNLFIIILIISNLTLIISSIILKNNDATLMSAFKYNLLLCPMYFRLFINNRTKNISIIK